jgi:DNA-binding transcriptional regulator YbjK
MQSVELNNSTIHRAIASHAKIQLSLTTYYFKDIQELIPQAISLSSKQAIKRASLVWQKVFTQMYYLWWQ